MVTETQHHTDFHLIRKIALWLLVLLLILVTLKGAFAITASIDAPATIQEGGLLTVTFGADEPGAELELQRNGQYLTNAPPYEWQTTTKDAGLYTFTVIATGTNSSDTAQKVVEVLDNPLEVAVNEPSASEYTTNTIPVSVTPSAPVEFCYYVIGSTSNTLDEDPSSPGTYIGELLAADGIHTAAFKCKQGAEIAEQSKTILIDTTPPGIVASSPALNAVLTTQPTLSLTTDEIADCVAWPATDDEGTAVAMDSADSLTHTLTLSLGQGDHNYYARCSDVYGNDQASPHQYTFTYNSAPTATVEIQGVEKSSGDTPILRAGTYEIELTTSEPVTSPALSYSFQEGGGGTIALDSPQGEGAASTTWTGNLIIPATAGEKAASFKFSATDAEGSVGGEIAAGKLFVVDTQAPVAVTDFAARTEEGTIVLSWYDNKNADVSYRIYRAEESAVSYMDLYDEKDQKGTGQEGSDHEGLEEYTDNNLDGTFAYYYAVAAIDAAGNVGPLSVVRGAATPKEAPELQSGDPNQAARVEQLSTSVTKAILDLEGAIDELNSETDEKKLTVIRAAGLLRELAERLATLRSAEEELQTLAMQELSDDIFQERVTAINDEVTKVYEAIPRKIQLTGSASFRQPADSSVQNMLLGKAVDIFKTQDAELLTALTQASIKSAYQELVSNLMEGATIETEITVLHVIYADRHEGGFTYVQKSISFPGRQQPVTVLEYIPKEFTDDAANILFTPEPLVVERDPVLQYTIPAGSGELSYSYLLPEERDMVTARAVRSVLFPAPLAAIESSGGGSAMSATAAGAGGNGITGNAILVIPGLDFVKSYWAIILGVLVIGGLLLYYFRIDDAPIIIEQPTSSPTGGALVAAPSNHGPSDAGIDRLVAALTQAIKAPGTAGPVVSDSPSAVVDLRQAPVATAAAAVATNTLLAPPMVVPAPAPISFPSSQRTRKTKRRKRGLGTARLVGSTTKIPANQIPANPVAEAPLETERQLHELLLAGHAAIDGKEYLEAKKLYNKAFAVLKELGTTVFVDDHDRAAANLLYYKILLYRKMRSAVDASQAGNRERLERLLRGLRDVAVKLPETESALITEAKATYRDLVRAANRLAIDEEF